MADAIERWRPVVGFEGSYEVSDHGNVRSVTRRILVRGRPGVPDYHRLQSGKVLKPLLTNGTHLHVHLGTGRRGQQRIRPVAVLVLEAFVGPRPHPDWHGCHNDGDPYNNRLSNLRWDTAAANAQDKIRHGRNHELNKTHCPQRHAYTLENTYYRPGTNKRVCRTCNRDRARANYLKRVAA